VRKAEGKTPLTGCGSRWYDNIKIYLKGIGLDGVDYLYLTSVWYK
jgi:hypothetical protein